MTNRHFPGKDRRRFLAMTAGGAAMASRTSVAGLAALVLSPLASGAARAATASTRTGARPSRVVVIGGAVCECVYALDAGSALVGGDITCRFPEAALTLPKVGYERSLSAEGILSLHPDLVLHSGEAGPPTVFSQLQGAGVNLVGMPDRHDAENVRAMIRLTAQALDIAPRGDALLARFDAQWRDAEAGVQQAVRARRSGPVRAVFVMVNGGSAPMLAGSHTAA